VTIEILKKNKELLPKQTVMRQAKYLNNLIEQDHRFIKKKTNPMLGFKSFETAKKTIEGIPHDQKGAGQIEVFVCL
jgi:transposase-like protein